ncbi:MAG: hypothetical protein HY683_03395 [Chloroflexi bacterium]|nr:hypothetical protein [Chloroflexota bacterium]
MPRKKSVYKSADDFIRESDKITSFLSSCKTLPATYRSWVYEYGILRLSRELESMIVDALVGAINNDTHTISAQAGITFPKHLTDEVCEYLIIGRGYFDFKGHQTLQPYVPDSHYLMQVVRKPQYQQSLEQLAALRNLAAHSSRIAKTRAKKVVKQVRMPDAGVWLKRQGRLESLIASLKDLATEIRNQAPY